MRQLLSYFVLLLTACLYTACSESSANSESLTVSTEVIDIPSEGGSAKFKISSTTSWTIKCENEEIWISQTEGNGDCEIEIAIGAATTVQSQEMRLIVKTDDGSSIRNIIIKQSGYFLSETTLSVTNKGKLIPFGKTNEIDSLMILTNTPWQLYGPDWLEAYHNGRWVTLSETRAMVSGEAMEKNGTISILLRLAKEWDSYEDKTDTLTLKQSYSGSSGTKFAVTLLGKQSIDPNVAITLTNGIACDWKVGKDVKEFYYALSSRWLDYDELDLNSIQKWSKSKPDYLCSWKNLEENTTYYLYTAGIDNSQTPHLRVTLFTTFSSKGQSIAPISNVINDGSSWHWTISLGQNCKSYVKMATDDSWYFSDFDAALAWKINRYMHDYSTNKMYSTYNKSLRWTYKTTDPILIVSWGAGSDGNNMSRVISRYLTSENSSREASEENNVEPIGKSEPIDMYSFVKNCIITTE